MRSSANPTTDLTGGLPRLLVPTKTDVADVVKELADYHALFAPLFQRREQREWAAVYLRGLLVADVPRKNIEAISLRLLGADSDADKRVRALQQFVGVGAWDDQAILAKHRALVDETLGEDDGVLIVDGSDFPKLSIRGRKCTSSSRLKVHHASGDGRAKLPARECASVGQRLVVEAGHQSG